MMWFLLLLLHTAHIELVTSEAVNKLILRNTGGNPCEGHVEVYHNNIWGYVGDADWSKNTEKVVCESTHCGQRVDSEDVVKTLEDSTIWLNELKCKGNEPALWKCDHPGWNASFYPKHTVKNLTCSSKINISLDRANCAGAVQYYDGQTSGYFCNNTWGNEAARLVCKSLGCGEVRRIPPPEWMLSAAFESSNTKMKLDCSAFQNQDPDNLWQCVTGKHDGDSAECQPAPVICKDYRRLQLKGNQANVCSGLLEEEKNGVWEPVTENNFNFDVCQQMHCGIKDNIIKTNNSLNVTCTDKVKVVLGSGGESTCYGTVNIRVNDSVKPVCASSWEKKHAEFVCKELNCGKLIDFTKVNGKVEGMMDHVECNGRESSLWHCQGQHVKNTKCPSQLKVVCSGSVEVKLVDGPGKCAGRLEIKFEGQPRRVTNTSWTNDQSATVCKQLKCGDNGKTEKFSQGSADFMTVNCAGKSTSDISECLKADSSRRSSEGQAVGIICDDHKDVFLKGPEACSGQVGIKNGSTTYWLSGSHVTWDQASADTVCQQMHCGNAISFDSRDNKDENVESYNCSSKKKSLFDCNKISRPPPDHRNSTAYVKCSGKIVMNLTKGCSGKVQVYAEEVQGDMCADTWTEEKSSLLCENLGCGTALKAHNSQKDGNVNIRFNSLRATPERNASLTQWNFVRTQGNDKSCNQGPAYVVCSGSVKPRFSISSEHCSGNIEVEYEGRLIPVCSDALKDPNTQHTICQELKCGNADKLLPYFGPEPAEKLAISNLSCSANAKSSLSACSIATSQNKVCSYAGLRCADWKVMVPVGDDACRGTVLLHSGKGSSGVSREGWNEAEKKRLCTDMNCGGYNSANTTQDNGTEVNSFYNKSFSCASNKPANIWECEKETPPSEKNALFIECQAEPNVSLSDGCGGELRIDNIQVCARNWDLSTAHKVCQAKHCGNAIKISPPQAQRLSDTYHVSCDENHSFLGQCRRIKGKCAEGVVSISCNKYVKFRRTEQYGGYLEVKYRGYWEKVCLNGNLSNDLTNSLCDEIKKENHGKIQQGKLDTTLECVGEVNDIKRCVKQRSCGRLPQAAISCKDDVRPTKAPPKSNPPLAPIIVGVVLLLLVVILIVLFIRFCVRRARKSKVSSRMLSAKDMEFESGEYEDVMNKENEMEDFSPGRFRSEDEFITENDGHSVSSVPYDDIDEADEARPLASPGTAAPADRDASMQEDGVTYEVEEPQESYDDIDTIHETTQTKAEVHDGPQTTHEPAAPPGLVQGDEDYLEPDQDG